MKAWVSAFDSANTAVEDLEVLQELDPEGSEIDAAAGATVSSEAVVNAVNAALDFYAAHVRAS